MCSGVPSAQRGAPAHGEATLALSVTHLLGACVHFKRGVIGEGAGGSVTGAWREAAFSLPPKPPEACTLGALGLTHPGG